MIVDGHEMTASHSELDVYKGCVALMQDMMERFEDYLNYVGVEPMGAEDEGRFYTFFSPMYIVERLFLWNTRHSGGTSQHLKCRELGIDTDKMVIFEDMRGMEEE